MGSLTARRSHRVAALRLSSQVKAALAPEVLDQLTSTWGVSKALAVEMFARLTGPDYRRWKAQAARCGFCARPVRLSARIVDSEGVVRFDTVTLPDGVSLKRCGSRRASVCPSCSFQYQGDMWHLLKAGLTGGDKGLPDSVAAHPMVFATLTAPPFGPVHTLRERNGKAQRCRPRREGHLCSHRRPAWCMTIHHDDDPRLGTPICPDCYDYPGAVLFNWWVPELWRRFTIDLYRALASSMGLTEAQLRKQVRISYAKVAELQKRGLVHFHGIVRLDAPRSDEWCPPLLDISTATLIDAIKAAAARTSLDVRAGHTEVLRLRFGRQIHAQPISARTGLEGEELTAEKVAA